MNIVKWFIFIAVTAFCFAVSYKPIQKVKVKNTNIEMAFPIPACLPGPCPIKPQPGEPCGPFVGCAVTHVKATSVLFIDPKIRS